MKLKEIFIAGLITADHILLKNGEEWKYFGSIGGGSAANVYFTLKSFKLPVKLIGAVGNKNPSLLKTALKDIEDGSDNSNLLYISKNSETREYYHLINKINNHWKHKFSSSSPVSDKKQNYSVQFRKSFFIPSFNNAIEECKLFYMDRLSKGLLDFADLAKEKKIPLIFDFGTISTRYYKEEIIRKAINLADIIQIPKDIYDFLIKNLKFKSFQELNPDISIWIITDGGNPVLAYHKNIGQLEIEVQKLKNILDGGGAGDAFMSMLIKQTYELYNINKSFEKLNKVEFIEILNNCVKSAQMACLFIGARTYIYEFLNNQKKNGDLNDFIKNYKFEGNYFEKSINLIENFGKKIQEIDDEITNAENYEKINLQKGKGVFESNLLNIPTVIEYSLNQDNLHLNINKDNEVSKELIIVGSGASYSVAKAMQQLFNPPNEKLSIYAYTPFEYILKINQPYPVCIISYSGTNPDVKSCFKKAIDNNSDRIYLLTGSSNSILVNNIKELKNGIILSVETPIEERGFVGVYSMMASICVLAKFLLKNEWKKDYLDYLSEKILTLLINKYSKLIQKEFQLKLNKSKKSQEKFHIVALGSNWAEPALIDFESKIVECNLGTIEISELKNYTHGRYINLYKNLTNRIVVIFETPDTSDLANFLAERLKTVTAVFKLSTFSDNFIGMVDLFIQMLCFINQLGNYYNLDPSKPGFPTEAKGLYNWDGLYRKKNEE